MPDWRPRIRELLAESDLNPALEMDIVEELAQHVEDRYRALSAEGFDHRAAARLSLRELEGQGFLAELRESLARP
jgi:hypothetical protein